MPMLTASRSAYDAHTMFVMIMTFAYHVLRREKHHETMTQRHTHSPLSSSIPYRFMPENGVQTKNCCYSKGPRCMVWDPGQISQIT